MTEDNDSDTLVSNTNLSHVINLSVDDTFNEKMNINEIIKKIGVNTYGLNSPTLKQQLSELQKQNNPVFLNIMNMLMGYCRIIDYIDCVHDFKSCNIQMEDLIGIRSELSDLGSQLKANLCSSGSNINVTNSHTLQKSLIKYIVSILQQNGVILPIIEDSFFLPKEEIDKYISSKTSNTKFYLESGRIPDVPDNLIQPKTICAIYDGCAHSGVSYVQATNLDYVTKYNQKYTGQVNTNIENYILPFYGNMVHATFKPSTMMLKVEYQPTGEYIEIQLINNVGITVNSVMTSFPLLNNFFTNAERGGGNDEENFKIVGSNIKSNASQLFLATCLKTVCDKIVSTELTPETYVGDILTVDGYVWAGVTYKYLIGDYPILPTIYESVKNGWNVRPGIYDINNEISARIIRLVHLYAIFYGPDSVQNLRPPFNAISIKDGIINSYFNLIKNYYTVAVLCNIIFKNLKVIDNIFDFLSSIKILNNYNEIKNKIDDLKQKLDHFFENPENSNVQNLLQIPLLEDVLKNNGIEVAMNNQQTVIFNDDTLYTFSLTPEESQYMDYFMDKYNTALQYIPITRVIQSGNCNKKLVSMHYQTNDNSEIEHICNDFSNALNISQQASQITTPFKLNFFQAICDGLIEVTINEELLLITFKLNQNMLNSFAKTNKITLIDVKNSFTNSVYDLNDEEDSVYVIDNKNLTITGPLEMEIIWILSVATLKRKFTGTLRTYDLYLKNRNKTINYHGEILFKFMEGIIPDERLSDFVETYTAGILLIDEPTKKYTSYVDLWANAGFSFNFSDILSSYLPQPNPEYLSQLSNSNIVNNVSLPGDIKLGGSKKNLKMQQKRAKINKITKKIYNRRRKTRKIRKI